MSAFLNFTSETDRLDSANPASRRHHPAGQVTHQTAATSRKNIYFETGRD
jgi:hypothetical protein